MNQADDRHPRSTRRIGIALAATGMLLVSTDSLLTRAADVSGWVVTFWFGVFSVPSLWLAMASTGRPSPLASTRRHPRVLLASGLFQAGSSTCFILAVKNTTIANVVVIIAAAPVFAALWSRILINERTTARVWTAIGLSLFGIAVIVSGSLGEGQLVGDLLAVGAILLFGLNLTILRVSPDVSRLASVWWGGLAMGVGSAAVLAAQGLSPIGHSNRSYLFLFLMGAVAGPASRVMIASASRFLTAAEVSLFGPVETISATFWAWLLFDEALTQRTLVGAVIVIAAVLWGTRVPEAGRAVPIATPAAPH